MNVNVTNINEQNSAWFQVTGECMAPLIRKGDIVLSIPVADIHLGDIVVIAGTIPAVHRVVNVSKSGNLLTKGDNSLTFDLPVTQNDLLGKVIAIIKKDRSTIYIQGRRWSTKNYLMAWYSRGCYTLCKFARNNRYCSKMYYRFFNPLKSVYFFFAAVIMQFCDVKCK